MNNIIKVGERSQEKITSLELLKQINLFRWQEKGTVIGYNDIWRLYTILHRITKSNN